MKLYVTLELQKTSKKLTEVLKTGIILKQWIQLTGIYELSAKFSPY